MEVGKCQQKPEHKEPVMKHNLYPPPEEMLEESFSDGKEAVSAALVNEKYGFTKIIGLCRNGNQVVIAEKITGKANPDLKKRYRLKTTTYKYFSTDGALKLYCLKNKIPIQYN